MASFPAQAQACIAGPANSKVAIGDVKSSYEVSMDKLHSPDGNENKRQLDWEEHDSPDIREAVGLLLEVGIWIWLSSEAHSPRTWADGR
jgi:hypothetical protein